MFFLGFTCFRRKNTARDRKSCWKYGGSNYGKSFISVFLKKFPRATEVVQIEEMFELWEVDYRVSTVPSSTKYVLLSNTENVLLIYTVNLVLLNTKNLSIF